MGSDDIRSAFEAAAHGGLRLYVAKLDYTADGQQRLQLTGWHRDGTPFGLQTAPFSGDPVARAKAVASDLITLHYGEQQMSRSVGGLARLMGALRDIDSNANALADRLGAAQTAILGEMQTTGSIIASVEQAHGELAAVNRMYSNSGPAGPLPGEESSGLLPK